MITRPLELASRMSPPPRDLDFFAWVNIGVIALFFTLLGSRFVLAPGVSVGVGRASGDVHVPSVGPQLEIPGQTSVVVSYRRDNVILFEGGMYTSLTDLRKPMKEYAKKHPGAVLLVRADAQSSVQAFIDLCDMAGAVGFASVQVAAEPQGPGNAVK